MILSRLFGFSRELYRRQRSSFKVFSWRLQGASIGVGVRLFGKIYVDGSLRNLTIGAHTTINHDVYINCRDTITIGEYCNISTGAKLITTGLSLSENNKKQCHISSPINLQGDVWLGAGATVLSGCTIADSITIGACSLVNKDLIQEGVYVGVPVRRIR